MHCIRSSLCILLGHHYIIKIKHSISMTGRYVKTPEVLGGYKVYAMNEGTYNKLNLSTFIEFPYYPNAVSGHVYVLILTPFLHFIY
jgi:hypothetical protein